MYSRVPLGLCRHVAAVLGSYLVLTCPVRADVRTFAQVGRWQAFGGTASDGKPVCGVATRDDAGREALLLKWFSGDPFLTIQVVKQSWSINRHASVPFLLQIDTFPVWSATALGSGQAIEWHLGNDSIDEFEHEFRKGQSLKLQLPAAHDLPWQESLTGSQAVVRAMVACMRKLNGA